MTLTLAKVLGATASTSFEFAGEVVGLTYHPAAVSPKLLSDLAALGALDSASDDVAASAQALMGVADVLTQLLATLDLAQDDSGAPYPLDAASLAQLPMLFLFAVVRAILDDLKLGESAAATAPASTASAPSNASLPPSSLAD